VTWQVNRRPILFKHNRPFHGQNQLSKIYNSSTFLQPVADPGVQSRGCVLRLIFLEGCLLSLLDRPRLPLITESLRLLVVIVGVITFAVAACLQGCTTTCSNLLAWARPLAVGRAGLHQQLWIWMTSGSKHLLT